MALTNNAIRMREHDVNELELRADYICSDLDALITALKSNANFTAFCAGAPIGNQIANQLNQIQSIISENLVGGIKSLAATTKAFLEAQRQINAAHGTGGLIMGLILPSIKRSHQFVDLTFDEGANVFSAKGFNILISELKFNFNSIINYTVSSSEICSSLSSGFASEDSNLSGVYANLASTFKEISNKLNAVVNSLVDELDKYAKATVANEEETTQQVESVNSAIDDVMSALGNINI